MSINVEKYRKQMRTFKIIACCIYAVKITNVMCSLNIVKNVQYICSDGAWKINTLQSNKSTKLQCIIRVKNTLYKSYDQNECHVNVQLQL